MVVHVCTISLLVFVYFLLHLATLNQYAKCTSFIIASIAIYPLNISQKVFFFFFFNVEGN